MASISTLAYGLTVKATDLLSASRAWPSLVEPFRFFDLVCLRKRKGTLVSSISSTGGAVEKVPVEVWEVIRKSLVQEETDSAEKRLVSEIRGPCRNEDCSVSAVDWTRTGTIAEDCDHCLDRFIGFYWEVVFGELQFFSFMQVWPIRTLVAAFGLSHPLPQSIDTQPCTHDHLDSLALIALPRSCGGAGDDTTLTANAGGDGEPDEHSIIDVDLSLPPNADLRFIRFIRLFNLTIVNSSASVLRPTDIDRRGKQKSEPQRDIDRRMRGFVGIKNEVTKEIKPKWKLYTSCFSIW
ncbi:hypothetical protein JCM5353_004524 [Sporobolomyces roseus]